MQGAWVSIKLRIKRLSWLGLGRFRLVRSMFNLILSGLKAPGTIVNIRGNRMYLDPKDSLGLSIWKIHEPLESELVSREILRGSVVIDIGANIGYYTLIFSKLVGNEGTVFAFEPDPDNFALLRKNVGLNECQNVVLEEKAVGDRTGRSKLYLSESNLADHQTYDSNGDREFIDIHTVRLDDYFEELDVKVDLMKMDIQGAEPGVIQGARDLFLTVDQEYRKIRNTLGKVPEDILSHPIVVLRTDLFPRTLLSGFEAFHVGGDIYVIPPNALTFETFNVWELRPEEDSYGLGEAYPVERNWSLNPRVVEVYTRVDSRSLSRTTSPSRGGTRSRSTSSTSHGTTSTRRLRCRTSNSSWGTKSSTPWSTADNRSSGGTLRSRPVQDSTSLVCEPRTILHPSG